MMDSVLVEASWFFAPRDDTRHARLAGPLPVVLGGVVEDDIRSLVLPVGDELADGGVLAPGVVASLDEGRPQRREPMRLDAGDARARAPERQGEDIERQAALQGEQLLDVGREGGRLRGVALVLGDGLAVDLFVGAPEAGGEVGELRTRDAGGGAPLAVVFDVSVSEGRIRVQVSGTK